MGEKVKEVQEKERQGKLSGTARDLIEAIVRNSFQNKDQKKVYDEESLGGETVYVKPDPEVEEISIKIGEILGGNCFGLDFIKTSEGYKVVDVNNSPGIYYDFIEELKLPISELFFKMLF